MYMFTVKQEIYSMKMCPILHVGQVCHKKQFLTETQERILMERFKTNEYLTTEERHELALSLNIEEGRITKWYSRKRIQKAAEGVSSQSEFIKV